MATSAFDLDRERTEALLYEMVRIRNFENKSAELYSAGKIRGFLHLYNGEEAIAAGVISNLERDDAVVATYREHGHALVKGISANAVMAELYGKVEGTSKGRGGSMHIFDKDTRFFGGNAIVGGGLPVAVGLALADKMQKRSRVTVCIFGDGAVEEGEFHESMNLAALWGLPVLFLVENNHYAMGTALTRSEAQTDLVKHAESYGMPADSVDGMDVVAVDAIAQDVIDRVRTKPGPYFLEARTYRFRAHSMFDAQLYREKEEIEGWKEKDPIPNFIRQAKEAGVLDDSTVKAIEEKVDAEVEAAVAFAEAGTFEPVEDLEKDVMTPHGALPAGNAGGAA